MRMPFGRYRGEEIEAIPHDYLHWLLDNVEFKSRYLEQEIRDVLTGGSAEGHSAHEAGFWWDVIRRIYHRLALRFHPDRGGNDASMTAINAFMDELEKEIGD